MPVLQQLHARLNRDRLDRRLVAGEVLLIIDRLRDDQPVPPQAVARVRAQGTPEGLGRP